MANSLKDQNQKNALSKTETNSKIAVQTVYQGPIPPASELEKYDNILPGAADRILKMAEKNNENEIFYRENLLKIQARDSLIGSVFTVTLIALLLGCGFFLLKAMPDCENNLSTIGTLIGGLGTLFSGIGSLIKIIFFQDKKTDN